MLAHVLLWYPQFWAILKVAATLFREESDGDDAALTEDDLLKMKLIMANGNK